MVQRVPNYCPDCGAALDTRTMEGRERRYCPDCGRFVFRNAAPCGGVAVVDDDAILLVERAVPPGEGAWTFPGGHLEADEPPAVGAARELAEETGVTVDPDDLLLADVRQLDPFDGKYVVSIRYAVARSATAGVPEAGSDAAVAEFVPVEEIRRETRPLRPHVRPQLDAVLDAIGD
jgi:ADP-ribose pyrophosphatase YjhB (NUDIX family)